MTRQNKRDAILLSVLLGIALLLRLDFLWPCNFVIDADEAIVGLMAKHINEGAPLPIFYYGQHYMGSFEPILTSYIFYFFGVSSLTLKIIPLIFSLLLIVLVYFLGREVGDRKAGILAALFCAIPPTALVVWSGKARGGFIELLVIGAAALLVACQWLKAGGIGFLRTAVVALLLGFGWWVNNQIIFFMLAIAFCFAARIVWVADKSMLAKLGMFVAHLFVGLLAFVIGGAPFWIYNLHHDFASFGLFGRAKLADILEHICGLFSTSIPIILGAKRFWENDDLFPNSTFYFYILYIVIFAILFISRRSSLIALLRLRLAKNPQVELLVVFILACFAVFSVSSFGYLVQAPRYLLPIYVGLFPLVAYVVVRVARYSEFFAVFLTVSVVSLNLASSYAGGRAIPGEPFVFQQQRVARDHSAIIAWLDQKNIKWVRTNYWIGYRLAFETAERIKFDVFQEPAQTRISSYHQDALKYGEERMPFILVPAQAQLVRDGLRALNYRFEEEDVGGYVVIYDIRLPYEKFDIIETSNFIVSANYAGEQAKNAVDESLDTRWGSAHPQRGDMQFVVTFNEPTEVSGVHYDMGHWPQDWPRSLKVESVSADGSRQQVFDEDDYSAVRYLSDNNQSLSIFFPSQKVKQIVLTQTGQDPVFDWSIAELDFYRVNPQ